MILENTIKLGSQLLKNRNINSSFVEGLRVTDKKTVHQGRRIQYRGPKVRSQADVRKVGT